MSSVVRSLCRRCHPHGLSRSLQCLPRPAPRFRLASRRIDARYQSTTPSSDETPTAGAATQPDRTNEPLNSLGKAPSEAPREALAEAYEPEVAAEVLSNNDAPPDARVSAHAAQKGPNYDRNNAFRKAFEEALNSERFEEVLYTSPFVPSPRSYPFHISTSRSESKRRVAAKRVLTIETKTKFYDLPVPDWNDIFALLQSMSPKTSADGTMSAVRVVLPKSYALEVPSGKVDYVDSSTGLLAKIRLTGDSQNPHAMVLRGRTAVLGNAVDELVSRFGPELKVYQLGDVDVSDYETKRLWPAIESANGADGAVVDEGSKDSIWVHEELGPHWIDTLYEDIPVPEVWTRQSFESYIFQLVYGRLDPGSRKLAEAYPRPTDTDGVRIKLISQAFHSCPKSNISPAALKIAVEFMGIRGGHRAAATKLLDRAEQWGVPIDTDSLNIMLASYAMNWDFVFFHDILKRMKDRFLRPNAKTWLHFLGLTQKDQQRQQIIHTMYEQGLLNEPATRRGIAKLMASYDAHEAFSKTSMTVDGFWAEQAKRYGEDWYTNDCLLPIAHEMLHLRSGGPSSQRYQMLLQLFQKQPSDGSRVEVRAINGLIETCADIRDVKLGLLALGQLPQEGYHAPNFGTYNALLLLGIKARSPQAVGVVVFYGALHRRLQGRTRTAINNLFRRTYSDPFWRKAMPYIFPRELSRLYEERRSRRNPLGAVEWCILERYQGYKPRTPLMEALRHAFTLERDRQEPAAAIPSKGNVWRPTRPILSNDGEVERPHNDSADSHMHPQKMLLYGKTRVKVELLNPGGTRPLRTVVLDGYITPTDKRSVGDEVDEGKNLKPTHDKSKRYKERTVKE